MSSICEIELENIRERTAVGGLVYMQKGGKLGIYDPIAKNEDNIELSLDQSDKMHTYKIKESENSEKYMSLQPK